MKPSLMGRIRNMLLSKDKVNQIIDDVKLSYFKDRNIRFDNNTTCLSGKLTDDCIITIGSLERQGESDLVNSEVLTATLVNMFHEQQHIIQEEECLTGRDVDGNMLGDELIFAEIADSYNQAYYEINYAYSVREIDAEWSGLLQTYDCLHHYLNYDEKTAFSMIMDYVSIKSEYSNIYDGINIDAIKDISDLESAFTVRYEDAPKGYNFYTEKYKKPPDYKMVENKDPAYAYLEEHTDVRKCFGDAYSTKDRNKIITAIMLELKPELRDKYKDCECVRNLYLDEVCYEFAPDKFKKPESRNVVKPVENNQRGSEFNDITINNDHDRSKDNLGIT